MSRGLKGSFELISCFCNSCHATYCLRSFNEAFSTRIWLSSQHMSIKTLGRCTKWDTDFETAFWTWTDYSPLASWVPRSAVKVEHENRTFLTPGQAGSDHQHHLVLFAGLAPPGSCPITLEQAIRDLTPTLLCHELHNLQLVTDVPEKRHCYNVSYTEQARALQSGA